MQFAAPQIALGCFSFRGSYSREEVGATVYTSVSVFVAVLCAALVAKYTAFPLKPKMLSRLCCFVFGCC